MSDRRPTIEDLGALAALPPEDPRRRAAEADPRTAALLRTYEDFVAPGPLPDGANLEGAEAKLLVALERELGVTLGEAPARRAPEPSGGGGMARFLALFAGPALRTAFAVAATVVVIAGAWTLLRPRPEAPAPLLRGPESPRAPGAWDARPAAAATGAGGMRLSWSPAPGATHYAVVFLAADLHEVARFEDVKGTELELPADALPAGLGSGESALWRVTAYQGADEIGRSGTTTLVMP